MVNKYKQNLRDFKEISDRVGMRFMIMEGTLLGAYRDHNIVKDDENDIDLGIMEDQFYKFDDVCKFLEDIGFSNKKMVVVDGEFHGGCWERHGNHIDIMKMIKDGDVIYNIGDMGGLRYDYPADIFDGYGKINYLGMELETPAKIEKFLETRYGDLKTPVGINAYSYFDTKYS